MYSFDIFDTLISRVTANPYGVFLVMQEHLKIRCNYDNYSEYLINNFASLRYKAEKNAWKYKNESAVSLEDIYNVFAEMTSLSSENIRELMALELQTEIDCAVGIEDNIQKVIDFYEKNEHVILISDMYLKGVDIRNILKKFDPIFDKIPIYVSCEYGCTKQEGLLYVKVKELENATYDDWTHYGDNYVSDICIPNVLGIKTVYIESKDLSLWEKELIKQFDLKLDLSVQIILGTVKNIRTHYVVDKTEEIGMLVGGVILFPYIEWIINQSRRLGICRLYFIARDGYILKKVADIYIKRNHLEIQTKYIYGSRLAWRVDEKSKRDLVLKYLLQEIDISDERFALVDLQGTGCSMKYIIEILDAYMRTKLNVFYYDMIRQTVDSKCNFWIYSTGESSSIIEVLCKAPHGTTIGYKIVDGQCVPELEDTGINTWKNCGLEDYLHGIELFSRGMIDTELKLNFYIPFNHMGDFMLDYCCHRPDSAILDFIGDIPHNSGNLDENIKYAPKLNEKDIFQLYMWSTFRERDKYYNGENLEYSIMRMDKKELQLVRFYKKNYGKLLGRIIHFYKNIKTQKLRRVSKKRVILYAAGKIGQDLYRELQATCGIKIAGWTDINYEKYRKQGYPVESLKEVLRRKYDILVIAIKNNKKSETAKKLLIEAGIEPKYIVGLEEFYMNFL